MRQAQEVRRLVTTHAGPGRPASAVEPLGHGLEHTAFLVDGDLVVRFADADRTGTAVEREAQLLDFLGDVSPLPVPKPQFVAPADRCLAYKRLPGTPLLDLPDARRMAAAGQIGERLGAFLSVLHAVPAVQVEGLVERDDPALEPLLEEAAQNYGLVESAITARRRAVERFLASGVPEPADQLVFSHNDLGIEHVLVEPSTLAVTGVIDWSDAAVTDAARDFGLLFRDLGAAALAAALAAYGSKGEHARIVTRARFHARCALLEDLAYGVGAARPEYVAKSLAGLSWVFPAL